MREVSQGEQDALMDVLRRNEERLRAIPGVHYVDVGYKIVDGSPTDELAIRIHVYTKRPESDLEASQIAPEEIEGVPVDVIQSNPGLQQNRGGRFDPLVGGVSIGNTRQPFRGSLGMVVFDSRTANPMGLSNHHVLVGPGGQAGDFVAQPGSGLPSDVMGSVGRWSLSLDSALCFIGPARNVSTNILGFPAGASSIAEPLIGMAITKSGLATQVTRGIIEGVSSEEFTIRPDPNNLPLGGEISAPGDSGSIWLRVSDSAAVGLHYAGETDEDPAAERAWAKRMANIAIALEFRLQPLDPIIISPSDDINFGRIAIGDIATRAVTITNWSPVDLTFSFPEPHSSGNPAQFTWDVPTSNVVASQSHIVIEVEFIPRGTGRTATTMRFSTSLPSSQFVTLSGTGFRGLPL